MIVPRSFAGPGNDLNEKSGYRTRRSTSKSNSNSRSSSPLTAAAASPRSSVFSSEPRSLPVQIPSRHSKDGSNASTPRSSAPVHAGHTMYDTVPKFQYESTRALLSSTAIPVRRKPRGRQSQRLPTGDYVADFSRLMWDGVKTADVPSSRSGSSSYVEGLFGTIDGLVEGQMIVGSEGVDENIMATRSISSDSLASLASPDDYSLTGFESHRSSLGRSYEIKRMRQLPSSESCVTDHPLLDMEVEEDKPTVSPPVSPPSQPSTPALAAKKPRSFKSSLTASLKAIRSAAQSVSSRASLFVSHESDDFLARSFFDIHPFLTDDKRPPPGTSLPSAQLRRYLNPYSSTAPPDSPTQLHFWQDDRHAVPSKQDSRSKPKSRRKSARHGNLAPSTVDGLPPVVQLATCLPPSVRTANASSPPIWLNPDGTPSNKHTANALLLGSETPSEHALSPQPRHREPRENRDFLRIFVCEMAMRRQGKLSDDMSTGRARLWLPPVNNDPKGSSTGLDGAPVDKTKQAAAVRWRSFSIDDL